MSKKASGILPKFEIIIIAVFFFSFIIWAVSRCSDIKEAAVERLADDETPEQVTVTGTPEGIANVVNDGTRDTVYLTRRDTMTDNRTYGRLYITINNLKVRKEPGLKSDVISQLPLFSEVKFLDEVTDSTFQINLGYETADEPYVKIRTPQGKDGWVYGAGVNYYKKKRSGVLE